MADGVVSAARLPPRIGRHAVIGYLADGGMAEIFLGKEPDGRPVVIKRILPHLARQQNFVSMFIDEARIGSQVKHPNVVEIYELGQVGGDLFMVMEYLAGESVSGLLRRMELRKDRLHIALGAYVIAEAAAGLHAAHDLRDAAGNTLGIVHRDISPSNLFVTYSGDVKVLDFGIATAADRISRTATGHVKGKFSYMSPEQCMGMPLDPRSDLWSLGVVLYELTTQRRLFKLPNELLVLKAVTQDPIPRPRREQPQFPQFMEQIVMKALQREPTRRHGSAAELRDELVDAMAKLGFTNDPKTELARVMAELFPERIAEKRALFSDLRAGTEQFATLPPAEVDQHIDLAQMPEQSATAAPPRKQRTSMLVVAAAIVAVMCAGIGTWLYMHRERPKPPQTTASVEPVVTMPVAAPPPTPAPVEVAPAPKPSGLVLHIDTVPPGASIEIDGVFRGQAPLDHQLAEAASVELSLSLPGYMPVNQRVRIEHDQRILIPLAAKPKSGATKQPAKKPKKKDPKDPFQRFD
ncbi:MAG TPA: serine/threonine-protein kinase [Kofleriaceae bacterium]